MREEALTGVGQHRQAARAANLAIELDAKLRFEREEPVPEPLLGDGQHAGCRADLPVARHLDERGHLVGAEMGKGVSHTTIRTLSSMINNYLFWPAHWDSKCISLVIAAPFGLQF